MSSIEISAKFLMVKKFLDFLETKIETEDLGIKGIFEEFMTIEDEVEDEIKEIPVVEEKETQTDDDAKEEIPVVEEEEVKTDDDVLEEEKPKKKVTRTKKTKVEAEEKPEVVKKTREPTFYNIFTKNHIVTPTESGRGMYSKAMAELWKESDEGKFFSQRCTELKKENKEKSNVEIYNLVNREWQDILMETEERLEFERDVNTILC